MTVGRTDRRWPWRIVGPLLILGALACGVPLSDEQDPGAGGGAPVDTVDRNAMAEDEQSAVDATNTYWQRHFQELFDRAYRPPTVQGGYLGTSGPSCGGQPSVAFNAFYCVDGDFLAWDENLMAAGYQQIGDAWVYLIIAHEWGHAIQARLDQTQLSVQLELQADCLAGATLSGAAQDGTLTIEEGDNEEIAQTLQAVADDYPWTSETDHGNAEERISAFNLGVQGGVRRCTS